VQLPIFAPLFVADAKGYFADEGLTVNLEKVKSGQDAIPLAASGKLDAVLAGFSAGMFSAIESGLEVKVVGSMGVADGDTENPPSALIVSKKLVDDGTVSSVADLKGLRIGALGGEGATSASYVGMALQEAGLTINDVQFVQLSSPDIPTGIKTGGIDAAFVSAPFWGMAVADGTAVKMWTTPEGTSGTGVLFGAQFTQSPNAQKFFNALARGAQDLQGEARYSEENLKIIGDATGQTAEQVKSVPLYAWLPDLAPLPEQLAAMEKTWMEVGALNYSEPIAPNRYVDTSFAGNVPPKP
jgi:NitT/TauT family transport system substrate-binding protein